MLEYNLDIESNVEEVASAGVSAVDALREAMEMLTGTLETSAAAFAGAGAAAGSAGDEISSTGSSVSKMGASMVSGLGSVLALGGGFLIAANQAAELVGKIWSLASAFIGMAMAASDAHDDAVRSFEVIYGSQQGAEDTYDAIVDVTRRVAISQSEALRVAAALDAAGERNGNRMVRAVESVGKAEAARKGAGEAVEGIMKRVASRRDTGFSVGQGFSISPEEIKKIGLSYQDLAREVSEQTGASMVNAETQLRMGAIGIDAGLNALNSAIDKKLGGVAEKKFFSISTQVQRLKDTFGRLFEDLNTSKIGQALSKVVDLFDETTVAGQAMKEQFRGIFDGIGEFIEGAIPYVQKFIKGIQLLWLQTRIALFPLQRAIMETFGATDQVDAFEGSIISLGRAIQGIGENMDNIIAGFRAFWKIIEVGGLVITTVMSVIWTLGGALGMIGESLFIVTKAVGKFMFAWLEKDWEAAFDELWNGLASGFKKLGTKTKEWFSEIGSNMVDSFKGVFEIASPSRVMKRQGEYIGQGLQLGLESQSKPTVQAMDDLVTPPTAAAKTGDSTNNSSSSNSVTFAEGAIQISGVKDSEEIATMFPQLMAETFEKIGLSIGAQEPA